MSNKLDGSSNVSLFPMPPWQLINKYSDADVAEGTAPPPPQIPVSTSYKMFGNLFNTDDPILRPLTSYGVRRVYQQTYNRKSELKKLNFSILANYLDLLDVITRDPSSPKRTEKLEHISILFINMHHLLNEYRPHQARDLLREMLIYQAKIAAETVRRAKQYLSRADETLLSSSQNLISPKTVFKNLNASSPKTTPSFEDLGPELSSFLTELQDEIHSSGAITTTRSSLVIDSEPDLSTDPFSAHQKYSQSPLEPSAKYEENISIDESIWSFLNE